MTDSAVRSTLRARLVPLAALTIGLFLVGCADSLSGVRESSVSPNILGGSLTPAGPGRYVVMLTPGTSLSEEVLEAAGGRVVDVNTTIGAVEVEVTDPSVLVGAPGVQSVGRSLEFTLDSELGDPVTSHPDPSQEPAGTDASTAAWFSSGVQWDMAAIGLSGSVWRNSSGGAGARACIIDSGIDPQHQELAGKVVADTSFVTTTTIESPAALDSSGHGTHVAGTVAGKGIVAGGVAPDASLMTAKVFAETGGTPVLRVTNALVWCADRGAHVINMSLGGIRYFAPGTNALALSDVAAYAAAVRYATDAGSVVVVAAGNSNLRLQSGTGTSQQLTVPAQVPGTIIVGATGPLSRTGRWTVGGSLQTLPFAAPTWNPLDAQQVWQGVNGRAFYSNFGTQVTVFAPGGRGGVPMGYRNRIVTDAAGTRVQQTGGSNDNIWSACSRFSNFGGSLNVSGGPGVSAACRTAPSSDRYAALAGTSMAAPHVAGLAAILYAELGGLRSPENRARVESCIRFTTDNIGPVTTFGGGRVNVPRAIACIRGEA